MTSSLASVRIVNNALHRLGQSPLTDLSELAPAQDLYPDIRDKLLTWVPWTFATTRQALARLEAQPASEFLYQYAIPTSPFCLRTLDVQMPSIDFQKEVYIDPADPDQVTQVILTDAESVVLKYIARVSEHVWLPLATDTLSLWLAVDLCETVTGKTSLRESLAQELDAQLKRLEAVDGHQDSPRVWRQNSSYLSARYRGRYAPRSILATEEPL
jgi:hypothetical protein